jgi:cell division protein FtsL
MKTGTIKTVALSTSIALLAAGCSDLTPGQNAGVFGGIAAVTGASIARAAGVRPGEALAIGAAAGAVVALTAYIIAKHQATERQRRVAEERARIYYGRLAAEKKAALKKKRVRYIAVDTEKNEKTSPKAKKAVMIWDTQSESVVGNSVYDVQSPPSVGSTAKFDTYSAEYVGSGG